MGNIRISQKIKCFLICFIATIILVSVAIYRPPLSTATASELLTVDGIGESRLEMIQTFIVNHPNAKVEDLRPLKGVDDMIINQLKRRFR